MSGPAGSPGSALGASGNGAAQVPTTPTNNTGMPPTTTPTKPPTTPMNPEVPTPRAGASGGGAGMGSVTPMNPMMPMTPATPATGSKDPKIPMVEGECPDLSRSGTISFGGVSGISVVAGAKPASATAPMVIYWHGTGSFAGEYAGMAAAVSQGVTAEGGVLISFQGSSGVGDSSCSGTFIFSLGDIDIVDQIIACAVKDHNIDPRRIYTTGCSAGGLFAACMAARRSSYVAAAAPNSGGFSFPQPFENDYTPALMTIHGAPGSDVVIIDFSNSSATADMAFKARGGFVINCNHGGGHCGGAGQAPSIWKFFKAHPYGVDPYPWAAGLPSDFDPKCKLF